MENNVAPAPRTTQTATVSTDTLVHAWLSTGKVRCNADGDITRTGRKVQGLVNCTTCHADLIAPRR